MNSRTPRSNVAVTLGVFVLLICVVVIGGELLLNHGQGYVAIRQAPAVPASPTPEDPSEQPTDEAPAPEELTVGVVLLFGDLGDGYFSTGTGVITDPSGIIVTNYHVVQDTISIEGVNGPDGERHQVTVLGRDMWADIAVLQMEGVSRLAPARIDTIPPQVGERLTCVGNARGNGVLRTTSGEIVGIDQKVNIPSNFQGSHDTELLGLITTTASAVPGYSGGPTIDADGEVVAMTTAISEDTGDGRHTYSIPIQQAIAVADQVRAGKEAGHIRLGPRPRLGLELGIDTPMVVKVEELSALEGSGLDVGDVVTALDDQPVDNAGELFEQIEQLEPGTSVTLSWREKDTGITDKVSVHLGTGWLN